MKSARDLLEAALAADPDDVAAHAAYADLLTEEGDPRGEFIQVQLALEDEAKPPEERAVLKQREAELLAAHERDWLSDLGPLLEQGEITDYMRQHDKINRRTWRRGWLDSLYIFRLELPLARELARAPAARLLRSLHIEHASYDTDTARLPSDGIPENTEYPLLYPLAKAPFLTHLRSFQLGETIDFTEESYNCRTHGEGVAELVRRMEVVEKVAILAHETDTTTLFALPNLTNLRGLLVYHADRYPVEILAGNAALRNLETLRFHPTHSYPDAEAYLRWQSARSLLTSPNLPSLVHLHLHACDLGDEGCEDIVRSGILKRLKTLDLRHGRISDAGAKILAACPDILHLEKLVLEDNELTEAGRLVLLGIGIDVEYERQYEVNSNEYLYSGDME
jgi:uncharacterized protein (TIGR02996 family)